jgi:hypothetical protein
MTVKIRVADDEPHLKAVKSADAEFWLSMSLRAIPTEGLS